MSDIMSELLQPLHDLKYIECVAEKDYATTPEAVACKCVMRAANATIESNAIVKPTDDKVEEAKKYREMSIKFACDTPEWKTWNEARTVMEAAEEAFRSIEGNEEAYEFWRMIRSECRVAFEQWHQAYKKAELYDQVLRINDRWQRRIDSIQSLSQRKDVEKERRRAKEMGEQANKGQSDE